MANIEINGKPLQVTDGAMVIEAADEAGITIPRFCYHKSRYHYSAFLLSQKIICRG